MTHLKRLASCLLAILLVITLIPGGALTTAHAAQATLTPDAVVNPADNVTLSKTAVQTAIDEWEVTLQISGGGSTTVKPQIDIVLVTDYSQSTVSLPLDSAKALSISLIISSALRNC